jgi:4-carboxymuconolactone decarboxylase
MTEPPPDHAAEAMRRAILGDDYVDRAVADPNPVGAEFQRYVTDSAWGVWARQGPLSTRDRSLLVLTMTAALGRTDEFEIHLAASRRAGVTDAELDELPFQLAAYCGMPVGRTAYLAIRRLRAAEAEAGEARR